MIYFIAKGHSLPHEVQTIIQVFYPNEHYYETQSIAPDGLVILSILENGISRAEMYENGLAAGRYAVPIDSARIELQPRYKKRMIKTAIYHLLCQFTMRRPAWGLLTGIRPAKVVNEYLDAGLDASQCLRRLVEEYDVLPEKAQISLSVALAERKLFSRHGQKEVSLYIGIPFCPTRCLYCSFTAYPIAQYKDKVDGYLDALVKEMEFLSAFAEQYRFKNIYIGGGTPTSLTEGQFARLLCEVQRLFSFDYVQEYTVEAGRPDTITVEKLQSMKHFGVNRISINPQTMNQKTLDLIGRRHTVEEIAEVYHEARKAGHDNINMDIIAGLPKEALPEMEITMRALEGLKPDSITVHTLAVKRGSRLKETFDLNCLSDELETEKMLDCATTYTARMGMLPYYMYRQKNMVGNFENIGYCLPGKEGIYNIEIMEERQTIFAVGAGASTKTVDASNGRIERIFNVKNVDEYMARIDEMIERKRLGL